MINHITGRPNRESELNENVTINGTLTIKNGSQAAGLVLISDANGTVTFGVASGGTSGGTNTTITGGTYNNSTGTVTFTNTTGGTFTTTGFYTGYTAPMDIYTTGLTFNPGTYDLTGTRNDGGSYVANLGLLATDMTITGGTYDPSTGNATFTDNSGGTFTVSGFITGITDTFVTGYTYDPTTNTFTISQNAGKSDLTVSIDTMSGLTVNGSFSATTYLGLPMNIGVTGGTYSSGVYTFTNTTGGTFNVTPTGIITSATTAGGDLSGRYPNPSVFQAHLTDQAAPAAPASGTLILTSFSQQGFSTAHIYDTQGNSIEITRDNVTIVRNNSGASIPKGSVIYVTGSTGTVPLINLAKADSSSTTPAYGIMYDTIANNSFGRVMFLGNIENLNLSAFSSGDSVYLSPTTAGGLTNIKPSFPNYIQSIGTVLNNGIGNGVLAVSINVSGLQPLIDLTITGGTFNSSTGIATLTNNSGTTLNVTGFTTTADTVATKKILYVSQDIGNDSNTGTMFKPFLTIQAAINAANLIADNSNQVIVQVTPSNSANGYNENITLTQQGITLQSATDRERADTLIKGSITVNLSGTSGTNFTPTSNYTYIKGFYIAKTGADALIFNGTAYQRLFITDCYIKSTSIGSAINMTNTGTSSSGATKSTMTVVGGIIENNAVGAATIIMGAGKMFINGGNPQLQNIATSGKSVSITGANAPGCYFQTMETDMVGQLEVTDNTSNVSLNLYTLTSGAIPLIASPSSPSTGTIVLGAGGLSTSATPSMIGSGVVVFGGINGKLSTGGDVVNTITQATLPYYPQGQTLFQAGTELGSGFGGNGGATATTNSLIIIKDGHITSQQTTAPTKTVNGNAGTSATTVLTNATDIAGHISLTTGSASLASGTQVTINFNKAYVTAPIVILTPTNALAGGNVVGVFVGSATGNFTVGFSIAAGAAATYTWNYHVIETQ